MPVERYLAELIEYQKPAMVYLTNGIKLVGTITEWTPQGHVFLVRGSHKQIVYAHAISTISEALAP